MPAFNPYGIQAARRPKAQDPMSQLSGIVGQGQAQGYLSPSGSPQLQRGLERQALRSSEDQMHRGDTLSRLVGLNPSQQQSYLSDLGGQQGGRTADFLNNSMFQQQQGNQDWIRQLFGGQVDFSRQQQMQRLMAQLAKQNQGGGFGDMLGGLLGTAAGAAIPGLGAIGGLFGGGGGGSGYHPMARM